MNTNSEFEQLKAENEQLRQLIREGKEVFGSLTALTDLNKAAKSGNLMFALPKIMMSVTKNPELIDKVEAYVTKINQLDV